MVVSGWVFGKNEIMKILLVEVFFCFVDIVFLFGVLLGEEVICWIWLNLVDDKLVVMGYFYYLLEVSDIMFELCMLVLIFLGLCELVVECMGFW